MRRIGYCLLLVLFVTACGSAGEVSSLPSTSTTGAALAPTLRGVPVQTLACPAVGVSSVGKPATIDAPQTFLLCPLGAPNEISGSVTVGAGVPAFDALVSALARPDVPPTGGVCPAYADLTQVVLAKTGAGVYRVSIPVDGCGHYERPALAALEAARAG
jgi:hypothetical protein